MESQNQIFGEKVEIQDDKIKYQREIRISWW